MKNYFWILVTYKKFQYFEYIIILCILLINGKS